MDISCAHLVNNLFGVLGRAASLPPGGEHLYAHGPKAFQHLGGCGAEDALRDVYALKVWILLEQANRKVLREASSDVNLLSHVHHPKSP